MNSKILKDYLAAASACEPAASYSGPLELSSSGEWVIGISAGDASLLSLRSTGGVEAIWNSKTARWLRPPKAGTGKPFVSKRFSAALFDEPIGSALAAFHALAPVRDVLFEPGRPGWTLVLAAPLAWPLFLRCDVAAAFAPRAAQLSLLLRDARILEIRFDGAALWARLTG